MPRTSPASTQSSATRPASSRSASSRSTSARSALADRQTASGGADAAPGTEADPLDASINLAIVRGVVASEAATRTLPSGDVVADLSITTAIGAGPRTSVPVSWHRPTVLIARLSPGAEVLVVGHVARRFFRTGGRIASRTEVIASTVAMSSQRAVCRRALQRVESLIEATIHESCL